MTEKPLNIWHVLIITAALVAVAVAALIGPGYVRAGKANPELAASERLRQAIVPQKTLLEAYHQALVSGTPEEVTDAWRELKGRRVTLDPEQSVQVQLNGKECCYKAEEIPSLPADLSKVDARNGIVTNHSGQTVVVWLYPQR